MRASRPRYGRDTGWVHAGMLAGLGAGPEHLAYDVGTETPQQTGPQLSPLGCKRSNSTVV